MTKQSYQRARGKVEKCLRQLQEVEAQLTEVLEHSLDLKGTPAFETVCQGLNEAHDLADDLGRLVNQLELAWLWQVANPDQSVDFVLRDDVFHTVDE